MITIDIRQSDIDKIKQQFDLDSQEMDKATRRAIKKTCDWMITISAREISNALKIKQSEVKKRLKYKVEGILLKATVWYGLNRISLIRFNNVRQNKYGITSSFLGIKSAFLAPIRHGSNKLIVFKRIDKSRLPVEKQMVDIDKIIENIVNNNLFEQFWETFYTKLSQESNFQIIKRG